jgi:hypothetical protein
MSLNIESSPKIVFLSESSNLKFLISSSALN